VTGTAPRRASAPLWLLRQQAGQNIQRLLAVWAVKTVCLLELAGRQQYAGIRQIEGYKPSISGTV
jgi:hypothetical protein